TNLLPVKDIAIPGEAVAPAPYGGLTIDSKSSCVDLQISLEFARRATTVGWSKSQRSDKESDELHLAKITLRQDVLRETLAERTSERDAAREELGKLRNYLMEITPRLNELQEYLVESTSEQEMAREELGDAIYEKEALSHAS
ncbi:hypothetical protein K435DRAFT_880858, partial [Dendrothele bispora CBS 962.96]